MSIMENRTQCIYKGVSMRQFCIPEWPQFCELEACITIGKSSFYVESTDPFVISPNRQTQLFSKLEF